MTRSAFLGFLYRVAQRALELPLEKRGELRTGAMKHARDEFGDLFAELGEQSLDQLFDWLSGQTDLMAVVLQHEGRADVALPERFAAAALHRALVVKPAQVGAES